VTDPTSGPAASGAAALGPAPLPEVPAARERVLAAVAGAEATATPSSPGADRTGGAGEVVEGATIGQLVSVLGGHPNTTRGHLARLVDDGLLVRRPLDAGARGRPAHGYHLSDRGRLVLDALRVARPVSTDELVTAMAEHLATTAEPEVHARAIGRRWADQLSEGAERLDEASALQGSPRTPLDTVVSLLTTAGFSPRVDPEGAVRLRTCPVLASARAHPDVVCTMHEEMLRSALDRSGAQDVGVRLVPFASPGACLVHLGKVTG
jgi:predicted ArsR family transcriptional regulator